MTENHPEKMSENIQRAVEFLRDGKLVAFPTETVYGLGADASNPEAIKKVFTAKGRPSDHPLIVHIADIDQLNHWARAIPKEAYTLAEKFWPGPLTLILKKNLQVSDLLTGGQDTIGLRIPKHPIAQALLKEFRSGIAAPSANRFGHLSPTTREHVQQELGNQVDLILEGGECEIGIESTIVDLSGGEPRILRPGFITPSQIESVLGKLATSSNNKPRVSGSLPSHYAPTTPLKLIPTKELTAQLRTISIKTAVLAFSQPALDHFNGAVFLMPKQADRYAHEMYAKLRQIDQQNFDCILVEEVPRSEEWMAIDDRLKKAALKS